MAHTVLTPELTEITDGLRFPEGPIAMPDGSVIVVELFSACLTRVWPDGTKDKVAETPGGPNGAAIGPDGAIYLCNNGGCFAPIERNGRSRPGHYDPEHYLGGKIQRVDLHDGSVTDLYTECAGRPLRAPNDLVMDGHGGFWFTDHGIRDLDARTADLTAIYHAKCDGSEITEAIFPVEGPMGSACRLMAPRCTGQKRTPVACSSGISKSPVAWRLVGAQGSCTDCPVTNCSTHSLLIRMVGCAWRRCSTVGSPRSHQTVNTPSITPPATCLRPTFVSAVTTCRPRS